MATLKHVGFGWLQPQAAWQQTNQGEKECLITTVDHFIKASKLNAP